MTPSLLLAPVIALVLSGCGSVGGPGEVAVDADIVPTTEEQPDPIGFIEVSVRIGVGDDAMLVSLAADRSTIDADADGAEQEAAACSGPVLAQEADELDAVDHRLDGYQIRIQGDAVAVAEGGAVSFELTAPGPIERDAPARVSFELRTEQTLHLVTQGELVIGEVLSAGVFSGTDTQGNTVEGAFLCG
jgi:hypothetical protein